MISRLKILITATLFSPFLCLAQAPNFSLTGTIEGMDANIVQIREFISDSTFYVERNKVAVRNGQFQFTGYLAFPRNTILFVFDLNGEVIHQTEWFYIDPGHQDLQIKPSKNDQRLMSNSQTFQEFVQFYQPTKNSFQEIEQSIDQVLAMEDKYLDPSLLDSLNRQKDIIAVKKGIFLLEYAMAHPQSYIVLMEIYFSVSLDYYDFPEKAFEFLDPVLQRTSVGLQIEREIKQAKKLEIGKSFPNFTLLDQQRATTTLHQMISNDYTLVDFWFNSCGFCIQQFPDLKATYQQFHPKGFEIIGITVDKERFETDWKEAIKTHDLPWPQYWDFDGIQCAEYLINDFPTNFLLDKRGEIVGRNLTITELQEFLTTKL